MSRSGHSQKRLQNRSFLAMTTLRVFIKGLYNLIVTIKTTKVKYS